MRLPEFIKANPRCHIAGESGNWLVVVCDNRAWRYETEMLAMTAAVDYCRVNCGCEKSSHRVIQIDPEPKPVHRRRELGWE
jgi:hypothetical protein